MKDIDLRKIIKPALDVVNHILKSKGLGDSNLLKETSVVVVGESIDIKMPDYATFVDRGRKAGRMPPIRSIIKWIRAKNIRVPNKYTLEQFAFAIAKGIAKKGTKGYNFLEILSNNLQELLFDYINKQIDEEINKI